MDEVLRCLLEKGEIGEGKLTADAVRALLEEAPDLLPAADVAVAEVALAAFRRTTRRDNGGAAMNPTAI